MKKRGQISVFLIVAMVIIIVAGLGFYVSSLITKKKSSIAGNTEGLDADIVKTYAETCAKLVAEDALFNRIGPFAGYIDPNGNSAYEESGTGDTTLFLGNKVPYSILQPISEVERKLEKYVAVEFVKCFDKEVFKELGMKIIKLPLNYPIAEVNFNDEDFSVNVQYPVTVKIRNSEAKFDSFSATLPIRFKILYDGALALVEKAKATQPDIYELSNDCSLYDKNGLTNVYLKTSDDGKKEIIQFVDFSTYEKNYVNSYIFQFAVKDINIEGNCAG